MRTSIAPAASAAAARTGRGSRRLIGAAVWLLVLVHPARDAFARHSGWPARVLIVAILLAFSVAYLNTFVTGFGNRAGMVGRAASFTAFVVLAALLCVMAGESGLTALVFVGVAAAVLFSFRTGLLLAGLTVLVAGVTPWLVPRWSLDESYALAVLLGSLAGFAFVNLIRRNQELVTAREEVAQLATAEERLRVARDIHDVLGQHLTAITVKSELAGKLIQRNLQSAEHELGDIQRLSREALADLRSVVSGYREVSLAVELARARGVLEAAGVLVQLPDDMPSVVDAVPAERRELFGWVIREGVTNVVRHSGAHTCRVSVSPNAVEVSDDGRGLNGASGPTGWSGAGLTGLSERVARTGGQLAVTGGDGGGFVLHVELPEARSA